MVMHMRKFKIPNDPPTTSKSIRFPNDVIEEVEQAIRGTNCTFSAFVIEAVRVALENLKEEETWPPSRLVRGSFYLPAVGPGAEFLLPNHSFEILALL